MTRLSAFLGVLLLAFTVSPVVGQVVETDPTPPRTDQSVTLYFNADEGTGGLEGHDGEVYAHTGISTTQNADQEWKCVKNHWPGTDQFAANRDDTQLTRVGPNRYTLEIEDLRAYYQDTSTECSLGSDEEIETMNLVFRNADGTKEGKADGGADIFVDVVDVSGEDPLVQASITNPTGNPPLYPFMTSRDTTVEVSVSATTANVNSLSEVRLFVDDSQVASTTSNTLSYDLAMDTPNRFHLQAEVEAENGDSTIVDSTETVLIRTPDVVDQPRPAEVEDGINYNSDGSVTLSLYAPKKDFVYAIGDFTDWEIDGDYFMKRHQVTPDSTHWWITLENLNAGEEYAYQYFVDGDLRLGDPFSHKVLSPQDQSLDAQALGFSTLKPYPGNETENLVSVLEPGQDDFNFSAFTPPEHSELVVYELLLRDFLETNSYAALTDTLDYLDRLGVNAIELMPVSNFGGNESWGYNPNFHLALDKAYGPPEDLKQFVEAAHQRGIAVVLDVVYNHATSQSPLVQMYGASEENPWLNVPASTEFSVFNQLNHGSAFIKHYIDRASTYWLEEFNVDGFRFDLSKGFISGQPSNPNDYQPQRIDNLQRIADHVWSVDPEAHVILEHFGVPDEEQELSAYRADETGGMMLWNNMNEPYNQVAMGFEEGADISGTYYENRGLDNPNYMTYMESHDEQWLMRRNKLFGNSSGDYSVQDLQTALNRQKLLGAFFFPVPGPRMMWQFGELGYGWGPEECLKPGGGGDGECTASDPGRTAPKPIRWEYRDPDQNPDRVRLYDTWSALIDLRNSHDVFTSPSTNVTISTAGTAQTRRIQLRHESMDAIVVGNFGVLQRNAEITFSETGTWYNVFANEDVRIQDTDKTVPLRPGEFRVYTSDPPAVSPEEGLVPSTVTPPSRLSVDIDQSFGAVTDPSNYRLVALPGSTQVPLPEAAFGRPGDTWRAFHDDGSASDYLVEYSAGDDRFALGQGRGLWLLSERSFAYEDSVASVPVQKGRVRIDLHDGWNIISNPLGLSVKWNRVRADNGISAPLYRWQNGSFGQTETFRSATTGEAFYFKNDAELDSLSIPYPGSVADRQAAQSVLPAEAQGAREASTFRLQVRRDSTASTVRLGYNEGEQSVRHAAPRTAFSDVQLVATGPKREALATHVRSLASDTVAADQLTFNLRLSTKAGQPVSVRALGLDAFTNQPATLVNRKTGATHELRADEAIRFTPSTSTTRLRLHVGGVPTDGAKLSPNKVRLHPNYPNPFRSATTIEYDIPEQSSVRLSAFDVLGRRVATLVQGDRGPGQYTVTWTPGEEKTLASGVYFLRLRVGDTVRSRRVTFVR